MENKEQQILAEIKSMMASIRVQLERLDAKMAELQQVVDPEDFEAESIDLEIEEPVVEEQVVEETAQEQEIPLEEPLEEVEEESVEEVEEEIVEEKEEVAKLLKECMESSATLSVPLTVEVEEGNSWYQAK